MEKIGVHSINVYPNLIYSAVNEWGWFLSSKTEITDDGLSVQVDKVKANSSRVITTHNMTAQQMEI